MRYMPSCAVYALKDKAKLNQRIVSSIFHLNFQDALLR